MRRIEDNPPYRTTILILYPSVHVSPHLYFLSPSHLTRQAPTTPTVQKHYSNPFFVMTPSHSLLNSNMPSGSASLIWFRKGLRIHDNPALEYASRASAFVYPLFVIDPHYMEPDPKAFSPGSTRAGISRIRFLLESLADLDLSLKKLGSRLLVLKGEPSEVLIRCLKEVIFCL